MARMLGKRRAISEYYCDISLASSAIDVRRAAPVREASRSPARLPIDLQQYRQDVAGLPRDRALKHNESSSIPTRERRTRPSS
ncbi:hypothetical protein A8E95_13380 [Burkholderia cenocepacia]|nr:hypothetical protein A8E96_05065 [Burkholderia cenocepacia]ONW33232.1 hypothetical protein A8E95_13380 [Burkholderia cenocepacia]